MASNASDGHAVPWRLLGWAIPVGLLMVPWLAHWPWRGTDFIVAAAMFAIVGGTFELAVRASGDRWYRGGAAVALITAFLLAWINLAVGIIGSEDNPLNLLFFGVIAVTLVGSISARFRPLGMARAMIAAATAQAIIGAGVFFMDAGSSEPPGRAALFVLIQFFAVLWLISAFSFHKAARKSPKVL